ncbi:MAG: WD40 repeat domain-containing serine/threonine protein kinase [Gemmatales bacterium]
MTQLSVETIYFAALEKGTTDERESFLNEVCGDNKALRRKVDRMLSMQSNVGEFLEKPVISGLSATHLRPVVQNVVMPETVGKYQVIKEVGRGGMGVVYQAWDASLKRHVAIKMVLLGKFSGKQEHQRFRKESEVVAKLQHPNIVQIHEVGQHQDLPYLVLEWIDGGTLGHYMKKQKLQPREAATLIQQIASGLQCAHSLGIIHRDLKPGNILLSSNASNSTSIDLVADDATIETTAPPSHKSLPISQYTAKLTDFGLAKLMEEDDQLTQTGQVMGTPSYLSPEQAKGSKIVGPANDIYSLGAILYELLSGQPPHVANTPMQTVLKVIQDEVKPLSQINKSIPADLATICHKCLMRDPTNRYPTALELSNDLQRYLRGEPISARPVTTVERLWFWSQRNPAWAATVLFALLSLFVGSVVSLLFGINANFHAEEATKQAQRADAASKQAMEERKLAQAQSASLLFHQAMALAEGGKIDQAIRSMLRAWKLVPEEDKSFQNAIRLNIDAWLQYVPRVLWQHDLQDERVLCYINGGDELLTWKGGYFHRRDTYTGKLSERVKLDAINEPLNITSVQDENRLALIDGKPAVPGLRIGHLFDTKTLRSLGKPITMMKEGRKYGFCRIQFLDDPELVVVRSELVDAPYSSRGILQAFHIKDGTPAGPEIVGSILGVLEPFKSADGTWLVLEGDAEGNYSYRALLTGKEMPKETVIQYPSIHSPARNIVHISAASLMGGQFYLQNGKYRPWSSRSFNKHPNGVIGLAFESNKTLRLYDLADQQPYMTTITSLPGVQSSLMNPSKPMLALFNSNAIRMYEVGSMLHSPEVIKNQATKLESPFSSASLSPDQKSLILIQQRQKSTRAFLMRTDTGVYYGTAIHDVDILPTWSRDSQLVALASNHARTVPQIKVVDAATGRLYRSFPRLPQYVHSMAFSHDKRYLAIGLVAGIMVLDLQDNKVVHQQDATIPLSFLQPGPIIAHAFSENNKHLLATSRQGWEGTQPGFRIWDMESGESVNPLIPTSYAPLLRYDLRQQQLCMIDLKQAEVTRFSMSGEALRQPTRLENYELQEVSLEKSESGLALNESLTRLAVGNTEGVVGIWNLENGTRLGEYQDHSDIIRQMIFSPDNRWLAIGVGTHRVRIRDANTGLAVGPLIHNHHRILTIRFSPDSRSLLIIDESGIASTWPLPGPSDRDRIWYEQYAEACTGTSLTQEVPRWLTTDELSQRRQILAGFLENTLRSKSQWFRKQALEYWRRRLDNTALYYLEKWSAAEPENHQPLLIRAEIYLATSKVKAADQCRVELIRRGFETEVTKLYRRYNIED